ncbi:MAG: hypothetical protein K2L78_04265, partial [Muribaculaceae bacterium]|nr:hypothetical protein [Muribaculaceae bacterium]
MLVLYRIYQLLIMAPLMLAATLLAALITAIGCMLGSSRFWGYWPAHIWARVCCALTLVKVTVTGRENIDPNTSMCSLPIIREPTTYLQSTDISTTTSN